jgi:hypothetical protein
MNLDEFNAALMDLEVRTNPSTTGLTRSSYEAMIIYELLLRDVTSPLVSTTGYQ